jgi:hypothetical protein
MGWGLDAASGQNRGRIFSKQGRAGFAQFVNPDRPQRCRSPRPDGAGHHHVRVIRGWPDSSILLMICTNVLAGFPRWQMNSAKFASSSEIRQPRF